MKLFASELHPSFWACHVVFTGVDVAESRLFSCVSVVLGYLGLAVVAELGYEDALVSVGKFLVLACFYRVVSGVRWSCCL